MIRLLDGLLVLLGMFGAMSAVEGSLGTGVLCMALAAGAALAVPRGPRPASTTPRGREAARLANFIVDQVLFDHFDFSDAELETFAASLPEAVRGPAPFWLLLHAGWMVREAARRCHDDAFVDEIRAAMQARLRLKGGNFDGPRWFATLDSAFARSDAALRSHESEGESQVVRIARGLLASNEGSPYGGRLSVPADVDTHLAACLQAVETHLGPAIEAFVGVVPQASPVAEDLLPVVRAEADMGPRERHLRRRQDSLLFPPERRLVSAGDLDAALVDDAREFEDLHSRALDALALSLGDAEAFDASHCQSRLDDCAALVEALGRYASAPALTLREQCRTAALGLIAAARSLPSSGGADATWQGWLDSEEFRFRQAAGDPDHLSLGVVPADDVPATVCTLSGDGIRRLAARMGVDSPEWQQLIPRCRERLQAAAGEGYPSKLVTERLAALGTD